MPPRSSGPRKVGEVVMKKKFSEFLTKNEDFLKACCIGVGICLVLIGIILFMQRGAHLDLPGKVLKVRTAALDDYNSVAMIDFHVANTSDYPAVVRTVTVRAEDKNGNALPGQVIADVDAQRVFDGVPLLGQKYLKSLIVRDKIPGHAAWDRMIGATFTVPDPKLQERKRFVVSIEEVDGKIFDIAEVR
jgi:hypothetical protein